MADIISNETPSQFWYSERALQYEPHAKYKLLYAYTSSPPHTHMDFYEISLIIKGSFINEYNGESKCYHQNSLLFWGPGQTHAIYINEPQSVHCSFLVHKDTMLSICERFHTEIPAIQTMHFRDCVLSPENATYMANISAKGVTQRTDSEEYLELFLRSAITHLFYQDEDSNTAKTMDIRACISDILFKLESQEYLCSPIAKLYEQYPVCRATLIKSFKEYTGYTIVEYRNKKRMEYSATLLSTQKYSVTQVASIVGISSFSYFSKKFYEHYGVLPSKYTYKIYELNQKESKNEK